MTTATSELEELAQQLASTEEAFELALIALTDTRKMGPEEIVAASDSLQSARTARDKAQIAYDKQMFSAQAEERMRAVDALHDWLKENILTIEAFSTAHEFGCSGFSVRVVQNADGTESVLVNTFGPKTPVSGPSNGTGAPRPRQYMRNRNNGEEYKAKDWLGQFGDADSKEAIRKIEEQRKLPAGATKVAISFQPHLTRMLRRTEIAKDWVLVKRYADGREE